MYKLILFDLDGTLLNEKREIPQKTLLSLSNLMSRGIRVGLATGRTLRSAQPYIETLKPNAPLILFNGARVWDLESQFPLYEKNLNYDATVCALELIDKYDDVHVNLYMGDDVLINKKTPRSLESEKKDGVPQQVVGKLSKWFSGQKSPATKIMLISEPPTLEKFMAEFNELTPSVCSLIRSEWNYLEIMAEGICKGSVLNVIEDQLNIKRKEMMAFGDNLNDFDLIKNVGHGVAMGNAHEDLKSVANKVIGDHNSDAVSEYLREIFKELK